MYLLPSILLPTAKHISGTRLIPLSFSLLLRNPVVKSIPLHAIASEYTLISRLSWQKTSLLRACTRRKVN